MRGSHHPCAEVPGSVHLLCPLGGVPTIPVLNSWVCTPAVPIMRGFYHPCAEVPGLHTCCAHYEKFPPSLC
ncbi:unnamed protein product [Staurois parvus]|uniref:Uncharacterized protein n=1 Tax=Staurois parvus TaxID=386267 RepID=A0ABN9HJH1_9NEOB|nr:unnamed protein product [Staurois parvus]